MTNFHGKVIITKRDKDLNIIEEREVDNKFSYTIIGTFLKLKYSFDSSDTIASNPNFFISYIERNAHYNFNFG